MTDPTVQIVHIVGEDTPAGRLETLRVLLERSEADHQRIVQFGRGRPTPVPAQKVERVTAPFQIGWLARRSISDLLRAESRTLLHVWSANALSWVVPILMGIDDARSAGALGLAGVLVDLDYPYDVSRAARGLGECASRLNVRFVAPTAGARDRFLEMGVLPEFSTVIRESVDFGLLNAIDPDRVRRRLKLAPDDRVVLILPQILRETGAFEAAWSALLLQKILSNVRLVLPGDGREARRVEQLVHSCRHDWMLRRPPVDVGPAELAATADLAIYLPSGEASLSGLRWAMAANTPIVASAVHATTELLAHGHNAWLCRAGQPRDAARRMLSAFEDTEQSKRQAAVARLQAFQLFSRQRMIEQYRRVYENLPAGKPVADGIIDPATARR